MRRLVASCFLALTLAACDAGTSAMLLTANVVSFVNTDKTLVDHGVSFAQDKDCSALYWAEEERYCRDGAETEDVPIEPASAGPYCYRSIGSIVCYRQPDPNASTQALVVPPEAPYAN